MRTSITPVTILVACAALTSTACGREPVAVHGAAVTVGATQTRAVVAAPQLAPTRQLRRLSLTLRGFEPSEAEYQQALTEAQNGTFDAWLAQQTEAFLQSTAFADEMFAFGQDFMHIGDYKRGSLEAIVGFPWKGGESVPLNPCPAGTLHADKLGHFNVDSPSQGDLPALCDDAAATINSVEPWWAPGTTVTTIGRAGNGNTVANGVDCGRIELSGAEGNFSEAGCGCGPNLQYCYKREAFGDPTYNQERASSPYLPGAPRRLLTEEPARLFADLIVNDRPFSDIVIGTTTVAPRTLQHVYTRWARQNTANAAALDSSDWWRNATDGWDEVEISSLHPNLLDDRSYTFDPRTDDGDPMGIPSAGVLTMLGPNVWYPRERVRAARWLETFTCANFAAPDPSEVFPPFTGDPYNSGTCMHCHATIDPAAIHFKRLEVEEDIPRHGLGFANLGGVGDWSWRRQGGVSFPDANSSDGLFWYQPYGRWNVSFQSGTFLTPVTAERIAANDDARFLDFLPAGETLYGTASDGTIGPLGFGKLIVNSGRFDSCMARRVFERIGGRTIDTVAEPNLSAQLVQTFIDSGRNVRELIRFIVSRDEFNRGI